MKRVYPLWACVLLISMILSACTKIKTPPDPELSFGMQTDNPTSTFTATSKTVNSDGLTTMTTVAASKATFVWTSGTANISKFKLNATREGVPVELLSSNLTNVDLFALTPLLVNVTIPKGAYTKTTVSAVLTKAAPGGALPLVLMGTFTTAAGTQVPVEFDFNENAEIKAAVANITADGTKNLFTKINMRLSKFFNNITAAQIDATTRTPNNTILISSTSNPALYAKIKANMLLCARSIFGTTSK